MNKTTYNWRRYWCSPYASILLSDGGYLPDPETTGAFVNQLVRHAEQISDMPCLILLGEPGIGKTASVAEMAAKVRDANQKTSDIVLSVDLRIIPTVEELRHELFDSPQFKAWERGDHVMHLFLDSFDECMIRITTLATWIGNKLRQLPHSRLRLRIACRSAVWPELLTKELQQIWGKEDVGEFQLLPLMRSDVSMAAADSGLDANAFLAAVKSAGAIPLAIKPVTLNFLIGQYRNNQTLPDKQRVLFGHGCRYLCTEANESRNVARDAQPTTSIPARLAIASRIAAVMLFSNSFAVSTAPDLGDVSKGALPLHELLRGPEISGGIAFPIEERQLRETLDTGLFVYHGSKLMGWAHRTYADHLAAEFLLEHKMPDAQIAGLLFLDDGKVVPQLQEVAARIAMERPKVLSRILQDDPIVLMRSDASAMSSAERAATIDFFLAAMDRGDLSLRDMPPWESLRRVNHEELKEQLRNIISDRSKSIDCRYAAIEIARACQIQSVEDDLVSLALNRSEDASLRAEAIRAISNIGTSKGFSHLLLLAQSEIDLDPDDDIKGSVLYALWPDHMAAEQLFTILSPPKRSMHMGSYWSFLQSPIANLLSGNDLISGLQWAGKLIYSVDSHFAKLIKELWMQAWIRFDDPQVLSAAAQLIRRRMEGHERPFPHLDIEGDNQFNEGRRRVCAVILEQTDGLGMASDLIATGTLDMTNASDWEWAIDEFVRAGSENIKRAYATILRIQFNPTEELQFERIFRAMREHTILKQEFTAILGPIDFESELASQMRREYENMKNLDLLRQEVQNRKHAKVHSISEYLSEFESGDMEAWWKTTDVMRRASDGAIIGRAEDDVDLAMLPGWTEATDAIRDRIISAAKEYIIEGDPNTARGLNNRGEQFNFWAAAGYRAFRLLSSLQPGFVAKLPAEVWKKWALAIVGQPSTFNTSDDARLVRRTLLRQLADHAEKEFVNALGAIIDRDNTRQMIVDVSWLVDGSWRREVAECLLDKVRHGSLSPGSQGELLAALLRHVGDNIADLQARAQAMLESFIQDLLTLLSGVPEDTLPGILDQNKPTMDRARLAVFVLMECAHDGGWPTVWSIFEQQPLVGRNLAADLGYRERFGTSPLLQRLAEKHLADLYLFLLREFPPADDPRIDGWHGIDNLESATTFRNTVLQELRDRRTALAGKQLERIVTERSDLPWLRRVLRLAQEDIQRLGWTPPAPFHILEMAQRADLRLVQNADHLLDIVIESLEQLQSDLLEETPDAQFLWYPSGNFAKVEEAKARGRKGSKPAPVGSQSGEGTPDATKGRKKLYKPREEEELSDYVKRFLQRSLKERGIIVNREVQIRRGHGGEPGQDTDIHIDAAVLNADGSVKDKVSVIIEVKGCWHNELKTAMDTQLVKRYLYNNASCRHGIYLVLWFAGVQWDPDDKRKAKTPKEGISDVRMELIAQAATLSSANSLSVKIVVLDVTLL
jgi:hypothetical protein